MYWQVPPQLPAVAQMYTHDPHTFGATVVVPVVVVLVEVVTVVVTVVVTGVEVVTVVEVEVVVAPGWSLHGQVT